MPWRKSPLSMNAVPQLLKVPALEPPEKVTVSKTVPNPVAVPSQVTWRWTSPAGPGLLTNVVNLNAILLSVYPMPYAYPPYFDELSSLRRQGPLLLLSQLHSRPPRRSRRSEEWVSC